MQVVIHTIPGNISGTSDADFSKFLGLLADTVSAPSFTWTGDLTTGIYHPTVRCNINCRDTERVVEFVRFYCNREPLVQMI
jgi:hypothetical protein